MKLTRRALYDLVWSKPMTTLAEEFGISDVGLAKICDRHRVPTPQRGYWAKIAAGQSVKKTYFAEAPDPKLNAVEISVGIDQLPEPVRAVIARQRTKRIERRDRTPESPPAEPDETHKEFAELHSAVRRTAQTLRKKSSQTDDVAKAVGEGECGIIVGIASIERTIAIVDSLARALEQRGLALEPRGQRMRVAIAVDDVEFLLSEVTRWVPYEPTTHELAQAARRDREIQHYVRAGIPRPSHLYGRSYPETFHNRTGKLFIEMVGWDGGLRRKWADGKKQRLEGVIPSIVDGVELILASRKVSREKREEEGRIRAEKQRRWALADARIKREEERAGFTNELIDRHAEIRRLLAWMAEAGPLSAAMPDSSYSRMVGWVRARLDALQASVSADGIESQLIEQKLFPASGADELHDPLGEPPPKPKYWY